MRVVFILSIYSWSAVAAAAAPASSWPYVRHKLSAAGFEPAFVRALARTYEPRHLARVDELNVLLYLRERDDHGPQATDDGAGRVREFLSTNHALFAATSRRYGVDPAVIASLLYIESRFGRNVGHFHVASVFLNLVQADRPEVIAHLRAAAPQFRKKITPAIRREIARRAVKKARWAIGELRALRTLWRKDPSCLIDLHGSFAGAIGWPQFLPSSYLTYAAAAAPKRAPDLSRTDDAVSSVANYLRQSGWRDDRADTHERAIMKYNQSRDYARAILKLARAAAPVRRHLSGATVPKDGARDSRD